MEGTWGDHIVMQAIAEALKLRIHVVESSENFAETTLVQPPNMSQNCRSIYIGHIAELHYLSTIPLSSENGSPDIFKRNLSVHSTESISNKHKRKCNDQTENANMISPD